MFATLQALDPELFWIICVAFAVAFLLAFSVGANDVSNSFGTSVGSKVLTVTQACVLATFFEVAGATLLGYTVCDTFRKNVYDVSQYEDSQKELMLGALACLIGSAMWNFVATALKMPISGTHSIVGATIGFSVVLKGWSSIKWMMVLRIVASWFASPILSGLITSLIYLLISKTIIRKINPLDQGLKALPIFYGCTIFINVASVVIGGPDVFGLNTLSWYAGLLISLIAGGITICVVATVLVPKLRRRITDEMVLKSQPKGKPHLKSLQQPTQTEITAFENPTFTPDQTELTLDPGRLASEAADVAKSKARPVKPPIAPKPSHLLTRMDAQDKTGLGQLEDIDLDADQTKKPVQDIVPAADPEKGLSNGSNRPPMIQGERFEVFRLFSSLQILTACFASFAHGTNDVSNAVAPLVPIWNIYSTGSEVLELRTQVWILAFGGIGICTGLWAWGRAVMSTVGSGLTQLTPSKGFAIELGSAISVLCATKLGLPVSTTHCKVGSVVIVGLVADKFCSQDNLMDLTIDESSDEASKQKSGSVNWKLFGNIAITWIVTVPLAAGASACIMLLLQWLAL